MTLSQGAKIKLLRKVLSAIKKKCKEDCCAGDWKSWVDCTITDCPLYLYRFGNNPENIDKFIRENKNNLPKTSE